MSLKNKWRKRGRLEFRRETARYSDRTCWIGKDILFIRIRKHACVFATFDSEPAVVTGLWANDGLYFKPRNAIHCANRLMASLRVR